MNLSCANGRFVTSRSKLKSRGIVSNFSQDFVTQRPISAEISRLEDSIFASRRRDRGYQSLFNGKAPLWTVEKPSPMEVRSSSRHKRMPIKSWGRKESPIDRRRPAFLFLAPPRRFSFSCSFSFPFTPPTWVAEATEAKGCPNWEVGIMGRINMQGLDTCGGKRWRRRSRRKRGGKGGGG